jgi:hypothetical protein
MFNYSLDSSYEFDFRWDAIEPEPDYNSGSSLRRCCQVLPLAWSSPTGRFVYWPEQKPADLATDDNSRFITCLETLPFC